MTRTETTHTTSIEGTPHAKQAKSLDQPEETRSFEHGRVDLVEIAGNKVGRTNLEPGWRWSTSVKPIVGTDSCQVAHVGYAISGSSTS